MRAAGDDEVVSRFARLDACTVSDAIDAAGRGGDLLEDVRPSWEGARAVGRAVTMTLRPPQADGRPSRRHLGAAAITAAAPTDMVVIDTGAFTGCGSWGGLLSLAASLRGLGGVVTDGAVRDVDEARALRFPVFARAPAARTARGRLAEVAVNQPVSVAGGTVRPGDLVIADASGVVVVEWSAARDVLARAEAIAERESVMAGRLRSGVAVDAVLDTSYETMLHGTPRTEPAR